MKVLANWMVNAKMSKICLIIIEVRNNYSYKIRPNNWDKWINKKKSGVYKIMNGNYRDKD